MAHDPGTTPDAAGLRRGHVGAGGPGGVGSRWRLPSGWGGKIFGGALVTLLGVLLGQQYMNPDKRVLPIFASVIVAGIAWRLDLVASVGVVIFLLPYPKGTSFGTTNIALALLVAIVWLVNVSIGRASPPRRTPIDAALMGLVIMYAVSFYNVTDTEVMGNAFRNLEIFFSAVLVYYVIVANVSTVTALQRVHVFQALSAVTVFLLAFYELRHPGSALFGGWILLAGSTGSGGGESFSRVNVRIGSAFADYELLSEFCVLTMLMGIFLWARAKNTNQRTLLSGFLLLNLFVMFATVTRGAIFSLSAGLLTMVWTTRRRLKFVPVVVGVTLFASLFIGMNFYVSHFTNSGDMFARLSTTHFENGVPDSRVGAWGPALTRALKHPWIGLGPYYELSVRHGLGWPHCVYLYYANIVGFVGLGFFLLILVGLARVTRPTVDSLRDPDYARAYQIVAQAQLVSFVVNEIKIDYLRNTIYTPVVWAMFSMWVATYFVAQRGQTARTSVRMASAH